MIKKEAKKMLKYKDLTIETQHTRNVKAKVIPVITGGTGIISKSSRKYLNYIPGKHDIKELQKTGHCACTLKSTNVEVENICHGK